MRFAVVGLVAALSGAPLQCGSEVDPSQMIEETPGEALYGLAQDFQKAGDRGGWQRTLEYLIRRYPSSRFAVTAKQDLANAGLAVPGEEPAPEDAKAAQAP